MASLMTLLNNAAAQVKGRATAFVYAHGLQSDHPDSRFADGLRDQGYSFTQHGAWHSLSPMFPVKGDVAVFPSKLAQMKPAERKQVLRAFRAACISAYRQGSAPSAPEHSPAP
ncbi:MAG: hypothetical protein GC137_09415 [Alphaproteobacteria bacterium]|nr:hypothetical protein [Alphaproteobacteria bacterium]